MNKQDILNKLNSGKFTTHRMVVIKRLPPKNISEEEGKYIPAFNDEQEEVVEIYSNQELVDYIFDNKIKSVL